MVRTPRATRSTAASPGRAAPPASSSSPLRRGVKVCTFNVKGEVHDLTARTKLLIDGVRQIDADILCMQELISPPQRAVLSHFDYHVVTAGLWNPGLGVGFPWFAYLPMLLSLAVTAALWQNKLLSTHALGAMLLLSVLVSAPVLPAVLAALGNVFVLPAPSSIGKAGFKSAWRDYYFDWMATAVAVRKSLFHALELVERSPFPKEIRGYKTPSSVFDVAAWRVYWFGTSFLRPGVSITRCVSAAGATELLIANVHLVTGVVNPVRAKQIAFVLARIAAAQERFACSNVLLVGDFNAHHDQPELNQLRVAGWTDAVVYAAAHRQNEFLTWVNVRNPLVPVGEEPDQRLDYIWTSPSLQASNVALECDEAPFVSDHFGVSANVRLRL